MAHLEGMREEDTKGIQRTTKDKYDLRARASKMKHDDLIDHMMGECGPDCELCDAGESGEFVDDDEEEGEEHNIGDRSSEGRRGGGEDIDEVGEKTVHESRGDKHNLMKHGEHTSKHPGFKAVQSQIAKREGLSNKAAGAILASRSRGASKAAKHANPRLRRVKG